MSKKLPEELDEFFSEGKCRVCGKRSKNLVDGVCPDCRTIIEEHDEKQLAEQTAIVKAAPEQKSYTVDEIISVLSYSITNGKSYEQISKEKGIPLKLLYEWDAQIFGSGFTKFVEFQKRIIVAKSYGMLTKVVENIDIDALPVDKRLQLMRVLFSSLPKFKVEHVHEPTIPEDEIDSEIEKLEKELNLSR